MSRKKVGVLYICTGKYVIFWKRFYETCEKYFLPGYEKQYFVFTDADSIYKEKDQHVRKIFQEKLQFPLGTLMRFDMFHRSKDVLSEMDYLYFFNANIIFLKTVTAEEMFPSDEENGLIGYQHAALYNKQPADFFYERNPISSAYIEQGEGKFYYQGCLIGGRTKEFMQMVEVLDINVKKDLEKNFIANWWDESHLNHYLLHKKVRLLHPGYAYPELWDLPFEKKIIMLDKTRRGGVDFLRETKKPSLIDTIKYFIKRMLIR